MVGQRNQFYQSISGPLARRSGCWAGAWEKEINQYGEYRTRRLVLEALDGMFEEWTYAEGEFENPVLSDVALKIDFRLFWSRDFAGEMCL